MDPTGRGGGDYIGGMDGECTRIDEVVSNMESSVYLLAPGLVGKCYSGALGNFLLNLSKIVANAVTSFCHM